MVEMWSPIPYNASLVDRVDMLVSPKHVHHVRNYLNCSGMDSNVLEDNLQKAIDSENDIDENAEIIWTRDSSNDFFSDMNFFIRKLLFIKYKQQI